MERMAARLPASTILSWRAYFQAKHDLERAAMADAIGGTPAPPEEFREFTEDEMRAYFRAHNERVAA